MNHAQAVILSKLSDDEIVTLHPEIARRHLPVLREWAPVGGLVIRKDDYRNPHNEANPAFCSCCEFSIPVRRIEITGPGGTYSYPEPLRFTPQLGQDYYCPHPAMTVYQYSWLDSVPDRRAIRAGFVHLTREAAEEHAKALILAGGGSI